MAKAGNKSSISESLRDAIRNCGLSGRELARQSGISHPMISRYLRGERSITLRVAEALSATLGLDMVLKKRKK